MANQDTATRDQAKKQLEFYFSDSNLLRDRFLQRNMDKEGYIKFATVCAFNKMKSISKDIDLLQAAVRSSDFLELSDDNEQIRRKDKVRIPQRPNDFDERNVYVENLPDGFTHDSVRSMFEACGKVLNVSLPRHRDTREFKGFGFVEFGKVAGVTEAVKKNKHSDETPKGLRVISKIDWLKIKGEYKKMKAVTTSRPKDYKSESAAAETPTFEKGCLLHVKGIGANARRNAIFETVSVAAPVRFVDYFPADGKPTDIAILRFKDAQGAEKAIEHFKTNPTKMGDSTDPVQFVKFTDEEEQKYLEALAKKMANSTQRGGKRGRHGGKRGGRSKRKAGNNTQSSTDAAAKKEAAPNDTAPAKKRVKVDSESS